MSENQEENVEWELADLVDTIASELEQAQDKLSLKSYARGMSFAIKALNLDVEVKVRRTASGKLLFRTIDADDKTSATVLKLDFAQVLQSQLFDVRKPLDNKQSGGFASPGIQTLPNITEDEVTKLDGVSVHFVDDLQHYSQTPAMIAELSRLTGIAIHRILMWLKLPFISEIKPEKDLVASEVTMNGGNFGNSQGEVWLNERKADIVTWSDTSLSVKIPADISGIVLFSVKIENGRSSNIVAWEVKRSHT